MSPIARLPGLSILAFSCPGSISLHIAMICAICIGQQRKFLFLLRNGEEQRNMQAGPFHMHRFLLNNLLCRRNYIGHWQKKALGMVYR